MNAIPKIIHEDFKTRNFSLGLIDIAMGLYFIAIALSFLCETVSIAIALMPVILITLIYLKKALVLPRLGYLEHQGAVSRTQKTMAITVFIGIACLIAAFYIYLRLGSGSRSDDMRQLVQNYGALALGGVIAFVAIIIAKSFEIKRFYIYALLILMAFCAMNFISFDRIIALSFFSLAVISIIVGVVLLAAFLKKYPRLDGMNE